VKFAPRGFLIVTNLFGSPRHDDVDHVIYNLVGPQILGCRSSSPNLCRRSTTATELRRDAWIFLTQVRLRIALAFSYLTLPIE
jgi:hypothetical protein